MTSPVETVKSETNVGATIRPTDRPTTNKGDHNLAIPGEPSETPKNPTLGENPVLTEHYRGGAVDRVDRATAMHIKARQIENSVPE